MDINKKMTALLKYYPVAILFIVAFISLTLFTNGTEFGNTFEMLVQNVKNIAFVVIPIFCTVINVIVCRTYSIKKCINMER